MQRRGHHAKRRYSLPITGSSDRGAGAAAPFSGSSARGPPLAFAPRMKKLFQALGVLGLLAWTAGGLAAWSLVRERIHVTIASGQPPAEDTAMLLVEDRLDGIEADLRVLAGTLGENLEVLATRLEDDAQVRGERVAGSLRSLQDELAALQERWDRPAPERAEERPAVDLAAAPAEQVAAPEPAAEVEPAGAPLEPAPPARKSFLAFTLPSSASAFDQRSHYVIVPALSRVGFDARSTLHDFTGATTAVSGEIDADLSRPADAQGFVGVDAASLRTGLGDRDEAMSEHLAAERHPTIEFHLDSFGAETIDVEGRRLSGEAKGRFTLRGVTHEVVMAVDAELDDAQRLVIEGEMPLRLSDYGVPVPSKLGMISMQDEVRVWIALRARSAPGRN